MSEEPLVTLQDGPGAGRSNLIMLLLWIALIVLFAVLGYWLGMRQAAGPGENSPETGFARDMMTHHAQAVDMATLIRDRSEAVDVRQMALDIVLTQQAQIGQMHSWLNLWGYPLASTEPAMAWMDMPVTGNMPGMAAPEKLNQLRELHGLEAEKMFLELMIAHHRGGVAMAEAVLERANRPQVRTLAQSMVNAQTSEIALMQAMLQQRGFPPIPAAEEEMQHTP